MRLRIKIHNDTNDLWHNYKMLFLNQNYLINPTIINRPFPWIHRFDVFIIH